MQGRQLYVMPAVRDIQEVTITFQLPCMTAQYAKKVGWGYGQVLCKLGGARGKFEVVSLRLATPGGVLLASLQASESIAVMPRMLGGWRSLFIASTKKAWE